VREEAYVTLWLPIRLYGVEEGVGRSRRYLFSGLEKMGWKVGRKKLLTKNESQRKVVFLYSDG